MTLPSVPAAPEADQPRLTGHFIVCGFGHVGYRIADLLLRLGERVCVVTETARDEWRRSAEDRGAVMLLGDARDEHRLLSAGLTDARALIAATDKDLVNVEIALDAGRLFPDLPIVVRMFDPDFAQQMEASLGVRRALAMSALAAPSFAAAALGEQVVGSFTLDDTLFVLERMLIAPAGPLAGCTVEEIGARYGLATLASERAGERTVGPAPETVVQPGSRITIAARKVDWDRLMHVRSGPRPHSAVSPEDLDVGARPFWRRPLTWDFLRDVWRTTSGPLRTVFFVLNLITLLSVFVFHATMRLSLVDALYFVVATVTTVGYGDITPPRDSAAMKLYCALLMVVGSATIATFYTIVFDFIVTTRVRQALGRQRTPQADHVVVVGLGSVGYRTVEELRRAGVRTVAIDRDPTCQFIESVRAHVPVIIGDARLPDTLAKAAVANARAVIAISSDDVVNLRVGLATKQLNPKVRTVLRLFDADFARKVQSALSVDTALGAAAIAAPTFAAAALFPDVRTAFVQDDHLFVLAHQTVTAELAGRTPGELRREAAGVVLTRRGPGEDDYRCLPDSLPLAEGEEILAMFWRRVVS